MGNPETLLRNYLSYDNGKNLSRIKPGLRLLGEEIIIPSGRIDLLVRDSQSICGVELKAMNYNTRQVGTQLTGYAHYFKENNGKVFFIAPKVKKGIYYALKDFYEEGMVEFYEIKVTNKFSFNRVYSKDLDDSRKIYYLDEIVMPANIEKGYTKPGMLGNYIARNIEAAKLINTIKECTNKPEKENFAKAISEATKFFSKQAKGKARHSLKAIHEIVKAYK